MWWTQVGDEHGGWSGLELKVEWRTSSWVENIKLGGVLQVEWRTSSWVANRKLGGEYKSWMENIKLGGEMCVGHSWVMDIGGWSCLEHQVKWC